MQSVKFEFKIISDLVGINSIRFIFTRFKYFLCLYFFTGTSHKHPKCCLRKFSLFEFSNKSYVLLDYLLIEQNVYFQS